MAENIEKVNKTCPLMLHVSRLNSGSQHWGMTFGQRSIAIQRASSENFMGTQC